MLRVQNAVDNQFVPLRIQPAFRRPAGPVLCRPPIWPQEPSKVLDQGAHFIAGAASSHGLSPAPECDDAGVAAGDDALDLARQGVECDSFLGLVFVMIVPADNAAGNMP